MIPSRCWTIVSLTASALLLGLPACGGGSGADSEAIAPTTMSLAMGVVSSTSTTRRTIAIENTLEKTVLTTAGPQTGPFTLDGADVPGQILAHATGIIGVRFSPTQPGPAAGQVIVRLDDGAGEVREFIVTVTASAEAVTLSPSPATLPFGEVLQGTTKSITLHVRNASTASPAPLSGVTLPTGGFSIVGAPFPLTIAPGQEALIEVRYAPTLVGSFGGDLVVGATDAGGPVVVPVSGTTGGPVITDFGTVTLDGSHRTPTLTVDVPADAISLTLEGMTSAGSISGLAELIGPSGKVYENTSATGEYIWNPGEVFSPTVPNTDRTSVQLEPSGGTYAFRLFRLAGNASTMAVRAIVERRPGGTGTIGTLDLDVWLSPVITPKAATASSDSRLQAILGTVDSILAQSGIHVGDVRYHDVTDPAYDDVTESEFGPMLKLTSAESDPRLNLFFVRTAFGGGVLGVAATIAGPRRNGTELSGVMSLYDDGYSSSFIGLVAAHEIGHFLGLYHTADSDGTNDFVDDTADCPAAGTSAACPVAGGGYLMHWQAVGGSTISAGQSHVLVGHPCVSPDVPAPATFHAARLSLRAAADAAGFLEGGSANWCGTCSRCRHPKGR